jgi:tetratricopeptide (TPR) repeat protein
MSTSERDDPAPSDDSLLAVLGDDGLRSLCSAAIFARGLAYARAGVVHVIAEEPEPEPGIHAQVLGTEMYSTGVWIDDGLVYGACDCPNADDGWFCKHQVAVALVWRDRLSGIDTPVDKAVHSKVRAIARRAKTARNQRDALQEFLHAQPSPVLADKLMDLADSDAAIALALQHWHRIAEPPTKAADLTGLATDILSPRRDIFDWRGSHDYARQAEAVLPLLRNTRERDPATAASLALEAMRKLWSVLAEADDSDGNIGDVCLNVGAEWVAALQALGPRPAAFADIYLKVRLEDPLDSFDHGQAEAAMGAPALGRYRRLVAERWREAQDATLALKARYPQRPPGGRSAFLAGTESSETESALRAMKHLHLEQLEAMGDIGGALEVLREDLSTPFAWSAVTRFLRAHGRRGEASANAEKACRAFPDDWHLEDVLIECYEHDGRTADALAVRRRRFERGPTLERYHEVLQAGVAAGAEGPALRAQLLQVLEALEVAEGPRRPGARRRTSGVRDVSLRAAVLCSESRWTEALAVVQPPNECWDIVLREIAVHLDEAHRDQAVGMLQQVLERAMVSARTPYLDELAMVREIAERMDPGRRATWLAALRTQFKAKRNFIRDLPK